MLRLPQKERRQAFAYRDMIRKARRRTEGAREPDRPSAVPVRLRGRVVSREHKNAIAQLFCAATFLRERVEIYGVHVAHVRFSNAAAGARNPGLQRKPDDRWTLPLAPNEHRRQHATGEASYWAELGADPHWIATELWKVSPDVMAMRNALIACLERFTPAPARSETAHD